MESLRQRLTNDDKWEIFGVVSTEGLPITLCGAALKIKEQLYKAVQVIYSDLAMEGENIRMEEPSYFIFGELSERGLKQRKEDSSSRPIIQALVKDLASGNSRYWLFGTK
jgi:hypothetical protein